LRSPASARGPPRSVRVSEPLAGELVGRGPWVAVRYRVDDPGGRGLRAEVAYSLDDGRSFRTLYVGPATGSARLPSALVARARAARIRVTISDGFNLAAALSGRFRAVGAPPHVTIVAPRPATRLSTDGALELDGTAFDDRGHPVGGSGLTWYAVRRQLGRGNRVHVQGLAAGRVRITLRARGADGRVGSASVVVLVRASAPRVLSLSTPRTIPASATSMAIRLATTEPATLRVGAQHYPVSRRPRRVVIRFTRGSSQILLTLTTRRRKTRFMIILARP
jgi:hypothetical protein